MRFLVWPLVAFIVFVLQTTCLGFFSGLVVFDLPLLFVYVYAMLKGKEAGVGCGLALGLVQDILTTGVFGFHMLTKALCGYYCGNVKEMVFKSNYLYHLTVIFFISLLIRLLYLVPQWFLAGGLQGLWSLYMGESIVYCLANTILVLPMAKVMLRIDSWVNEEKLTY